MSESSRSPFKKQDGDDYDDDEHHGKHRAHHPKHLGLLHAACQLVVIHGHHDGF